LDRWIGYPFQAASILRGAVNMPSAGNVGSFEGSVVEALPNEMFRVELDSGDEVLAYRSGRMRELHSTVQIGDRVRVEAKKFDRSRGKIIHRIG
jgi:translation initiation factor IF-1